MSLSPNSPTAPAAPDTQKVAVGLLVAEAMGKANNATHKQLQSQKEIDQQFMEQSISKVIQQILSNAPDNETALAQIKSFLGEMDADDATWGSDIQNWVSEQLKTANSYSPPQDLVNKLNDAMQSISEDLQDLQGAENTLNAAKASKDGLEDRIQALEKAMDKAPWYKKIEYALAIAGLGIAIGAVDTAIAIDQFCVNGYKSNLDNDQRIAARDKLQLKNDPALAGHISCLAENNTVLQQEASQNVAAYKSTENVIKSFDESMVAIIKELTSSVGVSEKSA